MNYLYEINKYLFVLKRIFLYQINIFQRNKSNNKRPTYEQIKTKFLAKLKTINFNIMERLC